MNAGRARRVKRFPFHIAVGIDFISVVFNPRLTCVLFSSSHHLRGIFQLKKCPRRTSARIGHRSPQAEPAYEVEVRTKSTSSGGELLGAPHRTPAMAGTKRARSSGAAASASPPSVLVPAAPAQPPGVSAAHPAPSARIDRRRGWAASEGQPIHARVTTAWPGRHIDPDAHSNSRDEGLGAPHPNPAMAKE